MLGLAQGPPVDAVESVWMSLVRVFVATAVCLVWLTGCESKNKTVAFLNLGQSDSADANALSAAPDGPDPTGPLSAGARRTEHDRLDRGRCPGRGARPAGGPERRSQPRQTALPRKQFRPRRALLPPCGRKGSRRDTSRGRGLAWPGGLL